MGGSFRGRIVDQGGGECHWYAPRPGNPRVTALSRGVAADLYRIRSTLDSHARFLLTALTAAAARVSPAPCECPTTALRGVQAREDRRPPKKLGIGGRLAVLGAPGGLRKRGVKLAQVQGRSGPVTPISRLPSLPPRTRASPRPSDGCST